jgi:hypothetical protein
LIKKAIKIKTDKEIEVIKLINEQDREVQRGKVFQKIVPII